MSELGELVRGFFGALDARDMDAVAAAIEPACDFSAPGMTLRGPEQILGWMRHYIAAFPDVRHKIMGLVAEEDRVAVELEIVGTHTAPLVGPAGTLEPTGRPLRLAAANLWRVPDGRIASYRIYFDQLSFLGQLGLA